MFWYFKHNSACGSLKHGQQFDAQNSNQRKKSKKKERTKICSLQLSGTCATLQNILKITECILTNY